MLAPLIKLVLFLHVAGGATGLVSGTIAAFARKGGPLHRLAGNIFFGAMMVMAAFAIVLAAIKPGQLINIFIGFFSLYLVGIAWLTVRRAPGATGLPEKFLALVALALCAPFVILSVQLATGLPPLFVSAIPLEGPVRIALYCFTSVLVLAAFADIRLVLQGGIAGAPRIARHLWRMCLGLTLAAGSGFTNGLARLLPGPYHVPLVFFLPQFLPVILLIYWMIRVRLTGWYRRHPTAAPA